MVQLCRDVEKTWLHVKQQSVLVLSQTWINGCKGLTCCPLISLMNSPWKHLTDSINGARAHTHTQYWFLMKCTSFAELQNVRSFMSDVQSKGPHIYMRLLFEGESQMSCTDLRMLTHFHPCLCKMFLAVCNKAKTKNWTLTDSNNRWHHFITD